MINGSLVTLCESVWTVICVWYSQRRGVGSPGLVMDHDGESACELCLLLTLVPMYLFVLTVWGAHDVAMPVGCDGNDAVSVHLYEYHWLHETFASTLQVRCVHCRGETPLSFDDVNRCRKLISSSLYSTYSHRSSNLPNPHSYALRA